MIKLLRWIGILPAAIAGWYLALFVALIFHGLLDSFCPPDEVTSGMCNASWYPFASRSVICFGAALSAFLVVFFSSLVAPSHRGTVAWVSYLVGAVLALYMAVFASRYASHYLELFSAVAMGLFAVWAVHRFLLPGRVERGT